MVKDMEHTNGYILKFYKKIKNLNKGNKSFHFVSFMNFDGVRIIPVKSFKDYQRNTINFKNPIEDDSDCSRQKLYIYNLENDFSNLIANEDIFDKTSSSFSKKYPILAITIINLKRETKQNEIIDSIQSILNTKSVKYKFFGSLSINDLVIVYRCKNFSELFECNFYSLFPKSDFFHSTYTIPCLLLSCANKWKEADGLEISIRSSIPPKDIYYNTTTNKPLTINGKEIFGLKEVTKYDIFGKYDIDIRGTIESSTKFIENFTKGIFFEEKNDVNQIKRNTNTRFLYPCETKSKENISYQAEFVNDTIIDFKNDISKLCSDIISGSQSNSSDYNHNLARLWLRAYQLLLRGRDNPILDDIIDIIKSYFNLVLIYINKLDYSESIVSGLKSLNTLIDNRDLNDFYEFENPHSNLMFSGCSTSLLSAYSNMANIALRKIAFLNNETKNYFAYITSDGYAEVSTKEMFTGNNECFLINIRIPTELMFDFKNLVCFILHEIGHNWNILSGKEEIFSKIFLEILLKIYIEQNKDKIQSISDEEDIKNIVTFTVNERLKECPIFSSMAESLAATLLKHEIFNGIEEYYSFSKTIYNNLKHLFSVSEEAKSDIFMIKCIGVKSPEFYLNVVVDYLNYKNIDYSSIKDDYERIMLNMFIRVLVVLIFLLAEDGVDPDDTLTKVIETVENYLVKSKIQFEKQKNATLKTKIDFSSKLLSVLKEKTDFSPVFLYAYKIYSEVLCPKDCPASEFRKKFDFSNDADSLEIQKNFEEYLNQGNDSDGFKDIINFINCLNHNKS